MRMGFLKANIDVFGISALVVWGLWCPAGLRAETLVLASDGSSLAAEDGETTSGTEASSNESPAYMQLRFGSAFGSGTFVRGATWNPYFSTGLTISSGFDIGPVGFYASQQTWLEWTQSDETTTPYQGQLVDPNFDLRYGFLDVETWSTTGGMSVLTTLPLSMATRQSGSLGATGVAFDFAYTIPVLRLTPYFSTTGMYNWIVPALASQFAHKGPSLYDMTDDSERGTLSCIRRSETEVRNFACATIPSLMSSSLNTGLRQPLLGDMLTLELGVSVLSYLSAFWGPDDAYTSAFATSGPGLQHYTSGTFSVTIAPLSWLSFAVGTWSFQPLLNADGKTMRFVFWDFVSTRNNYSTIFFDVIITI